MTRKQNPKCISCGRFYAQYKSLKCKACNGQLELDLGIIIKVKKFTDALQDG